MIGVIPCSKALRTFLLTSSFVSPKYSLLSECPRTTYLTPALAEAIYNATGVRLTELPMTPEKIAMEILKNRESIRSGTKVEE